MQLFVQVSVLSHQIINKRGGQIRIKLMHNCVPLAIFIYNK